MSVPSAPPAVLKLYDRYEKEEAAKILGLPYHQRSRQQGVIRSGNFLLLFVALDKRGLDRAHQYHDFFEDPDTFHWESQNRDIQDSGTGSLYSTHIEDGRTVLLFVRSRKMGGKRAEEFLYVGPVKHALSYGNKPIIVRWRLEKTIPQAVFKLLGAPYVSVRPRHREEKPSRDLSTNRTTQPTLFARVGWMRSYGGPTAADPRPIGGGKYNKTHVGNEVYNFRAVGDKVYGYFRVGRTARARIPLWRIRPEPDRRFGALPLVTIVWIASDPSGSGQKVIGWYKGATVYSTSRSNPSDADMECWCEAAVENALLLSPEERTANEWKVPRQTAGGMGQSNVFYPIDPIGHPRHADWIERIGKAIVSYELGPQTSLERDSTSHSDPWRGQGFLSSKEERKAIEDRAMMVVTTLFEKRGFDVKDTHRGRPFDLKCRRGNRTLYVEVKGTQGDGSSIILTAREWKFAVANRESMALAVVSGISVSEDSRATGGKVAIVRPFDPSNLESQPIAYTVRLI